MHTFGYTKGESGVFDPPETCWGLVRSLFQGFPTHNINSDEPEALGEGAAAHNLGSRWHMLSGFLDVEQNHGLPLDVPPLLALWQPPPPSENLKEL